MSLMKVLRNIEEQINNEELKNKNETGLKQNIWGILTALSWPDTDIKNEYQLSTGDRPDFALIHPDNQEPLVFIELKRHSLTKLKKSKEQVEGYASNSAVPLIVLTDVKTWLFYYKGELAFETGFSSQSLTKVSKQLKEFLEPDRVYRGDVYLSAKGALKKKDNLAKARKRIPASWRQFLKEERNSSRKNLINELRKKAGAGLGVQLADGDVVDFLRSLKEPASKSGEQDSPTPRDNGSKVEKRKGGGRSGELVILGKSFPYKNPTDAMVIVFKELERREPGFCQRFYNDPRNHGRTRRIIAQDERGLYDSDNPRYAKAYKRLDGDWVIATYNNKKTIEKNIRIAAEVAGLVFGRDIIITLNNGGQSKSQSPLQNPDTVFQVGSVRRKFQTGSVRQQVFNLINEGKEVTLGTIINTIPKDKAVVALRNLVKRKIIVIK